LAKYHNQFLQIHNIPFSFTDAQLRSICQEQEALPQQANKSTAITECRIMHDIKGEDKKGRPIFGKSKGFGFVNFEDHATALHCLQKLNNNPEIFTNERVSPQKSAVNI
jgi:RNA recognition motif-containing protein